MITFCVILRINLDFLLLLWVYAAIKFYDFACFGFETTPRILFLYIVEENGLDHSVQIPRTWKENCCSRKKL